MAAEKSGEFRGKSVEAAISSGLAALGVGRDQVEVEVVRPGSRGLLGIGAEDAVVRLTVLTGLGPRPEPARAEPKPAEEGAPSVEPALPREGREAREARPRGEPRGEGAGRAGGASRARTQPRPEPAAPAATSGPAPEAAPTAEAGAEQPLRAADSVERGREILEKLLDYMGLNARVEVLSQSESDLAAGERGGTVLNIVGEDLGLLIGRQSEVLSSLQFLTRLMVNQQSRGRANLVVDVNGYKAKRAESLRKLAMRTAEQVMQTGRTMALEPMPPAERRIIHLTLRNHPSVITQSVGEGAKRKVTVVPKKTE